MVCVHMRGKKRQIYATESCIIHLFILPVFMFYQSLNCGWLDGCLARLDSTIVLRVCAYLWIKIRSNPYTDLFCHRFLLCVHLFFGFRVSPPILSIGITIYFTVYDVYSASLVSNCSSRCCLSLSLSQQRIAHRNFDDLDLFAHKQNRSLSVGCKFHTELCEMEKNELIWIVIWFQIIYFRIFICNVHSHGPISECVCVWIRVCKMLHTNIRYWSKYINWMKSNHEHLLNEQLRF